MATTPVPLTVGESLAHISRARLWAAAILAQLTFPVLPGLSVWVSLLYGLPFPDGPFSFLAGVPWRLALLLAWCAYLGVFFLVKSYADLYLPRTPVAVAEKMTGVGLWAVGVAVLGLMVGTVMGLQVSDTRILAACTAAPAACIVGLVALWVWLSRTYGGGGTDDAESKQAPTPSGVARRRLPV